MIWDICLPVDFVKISNHIIGQMITAQWPNNKMIASFVQKTREMKALGFTRDGGQARMKDPYK